MFQIEIKDSATISLGNGKIVRTPRTIFVKTIEETDKWKMILRNNGLFDYSIKEIKVVNNTFSDLKNNTNNEKGANFKFPTRPSKMLKEIQPKINLKIKK